MAKVAEMQKHLLLLLKIPLAGRVAGMRVNGGWQYGTGSIVTPFVVTSSITQNNSPLYNEIGEPIEIWYDIINPDRDESVGAEDAPRQFIE